MKKLLSLLISVLFIFTLGACSSAKSESSGSKDTSRNESKKVQLSETTLEDATFSYPSDAQKLDVGEQDYPVVAYLLNADGSNFNLVVETLPTEMSLKEYIEAVKENAGYNYTEERYFTQNDLEWNELVAKADNGIMLRQSAVIYNQKAYIFSYGAKPENVDKHLETYKNILKSVTFAK